MRRIKNSRKRAFVEQALDRMSMKTFVDVWNYYCETGCDDEGKIYPMEAFNETFSYLTPADVADLVYGMNFNTNDDWFTAANAGYSVKSDCDAKFLVQDDYEDLVDDITENLYFYHEYIHEEQLDEFLTEEMFDGDEEAYKKMRTWFDEEYAAPIEDMEFEEIYDVYQESLQ